MKIGNEYADAIDKTFYENIPKAVLAALAVSYASAGGDQLADVTDRLLKEWDVLHANGIVPQSPFRYNARPNGVNRD
jgi:hypothetical protein